MAKSKADNQIMKLREELLKKKAEILNAEKPVYVAGEFFRPNVFEQRSEFSVAGANASQLLSGVKSLMYHEEAAKVLDMPSTHLGFSTAEWIKDFKTRKTVLDRTENLKKVAAIEETLRPLLTRDQLREIGIGELADAVASL
jgi:hypothetical protein